MTDLGDTIRAQRAAHDLGADRFDDAAWLLAQGAAIARLWSGEVAPASRHAAVQLLWSPEALHVRFHCEQHESMVVSAEPDTRGKTIGLWDRDVCEAFIAPDPYAPHKYLEFEAAPTGEWLDLAIEWAQGSRLTDWEFNSGMTAAARSDENRLMIAMRLPWLAFGRAPQEGERWGANFFRCVGTDEATRYLAWQPTRTTKPNFHVPQAFGWIEFAA